MASRVPTQKTFDIQNEAKVVEKSTFVIWRPTACSWNSKYWRQTILLHLQFEKVRIMQLVVGKDFATGGGLNPVALLISQAAQ